jgi:hypothetical protein
MGTVNNGRDSFVCPLVLQDEQQKLRHNELAISGLIDKFYSTSTG